MSGHAGEHAPFPAEVLHELGRQLDRVPFDTAYSGDAQIVDSGEQMVQPMTEFVKQGYHLVVRKQRRLVSERCGKVADEMGDRGPETAGDSLPRDRLIHPCAAPLGFARVRIQIELADEAAVRVGNPKKTHLRMPGFSFVRENANAIE